MHMFLYLHVYISVCVCVWFKTHDDIPTCHPVQHSLGPHYYSSQGLFWCWEPHRRGLWLGGRGVGGGPAPLRSFLLPPRGAGHSVYRWQAGSDKEPPCTANGCVNGAGGRPRHAAHTRAASRKLRMQVLRSPPGGLLQGSTHVQRTLQRRRRACAGEKPHTLQRER